jgi:hypothetical protein
MPMPGIADAWTSTHQHFKLLSGNLSESHFSNNFVTKRAMSSDDTMLRLERVTARLEQLESRLNLEPVSGNAAPANKAGASGAVISPFVIEFDNLLDTYLAPIVEKSKTIGTDVEKIVREFNNALLAQRQMLVIASKSKKPSDEETFQKYGNLSSLHFLSLRMS